MGLFVWAYWWALRLYHPSLSNTPLPRCPCISDIATLPTQHENPVAAYPILLEQSWKGEKAMALKAVHVSGISNLVQVPENAALAISGGVRFSKGQCLMN